MLAAVTCAAGAGALVASAFVHWLRRGPGHTLRGHRLVDTVLSLGRDVMGDGAARLVLLWYLVPAAGAAVWITIGWYGATARATRLVCAIAALVSAAVIAVFTHVAGADALGPGPYLAGGGAVLIVTGSWTSARMPRSGP